MYVCMYIYVYRWSEVGDSPLARYDPKLVAGVAPRTSSARRFISISTYFRYR